ncbi:DUF2273 domain-containing protein [Saccharomonospora piscinae]|uniref:DUF2273 domain-containing protein n=1 Tax=Saccharomonospora piscinae TaxID=687388 RepID=A0A1V9AC29_SACPI|nr:DUF2273 domain-containing protein [Saccharomonospora piscinae]OQO94631.1 DUF2273 domain-containing protein [Saccharomonospora piscinae]TLW94672.1 DUF2273 domain-containing protein [Saccharomonospora piscinae]
MTRAYMGTLVGVAFGLAWAFGGFGQMLIVVFVALIGYVVGKVLDGDIDVYRFVPERRQSR